MTCRTLCAALLALLLLALLLLALCPAALADSWKDEGNYNTSWYSDAETVFHISAPAQLAGLAKLIGEGKTFAGKTVYLDKDLDMNGHKWFCPTSSFQGTFDGLGHAIKGLSMNGSYVCMGLFGWLMDATVQNLSIEDASFAATTELDTWCGLVAAYAGGTTCIRNCSTAGTVSIRKSRRIPCSVGGLVGFARGTLTVSACSSEATLKCDSTGLSDHNADSMGGIVGEYSSRYNNKLTVQDCLFTGTIRNIQNKVGADIGGMVGLGDWDRTAISNCLMLGLMQGEPHSDQLYPYRFNRIAGSSIDAPEKVEDCYYVERAGEGQQSTGGSSAGYPGLGIKPNNAQPMTLNEMKTPGFLATLNAKASADVVWTAGTDGTPMPGFELAVYTEVDAAIAAAGALNQADYVDFSDVEAEVNAVVRDLRSFDQDKVTAMAKAITDAIDALVRNTPDQPDQPDVAGLPRTGDTSQLPLWGALALACLLALAALRRRSGARM